MYICSAEDLHSYLGETEGLVLVDRYVSELPLVSIETTLLYVATSESVYPLIFPPRPRSFKMIEISFFMKMRHKQVS